MRSRRWVGRYVGTVSMALVLTVGAQAVVPGPCSATFASSGNATHTVGTATLGPATAPAAARGSCVASVSTAIVVSWATSSVATGYLVNYGTTNGGPYGTSVAASGGGTTSKTISVSFSTTYYAVVVATVGGWTSSQTAQVSVTTPSILCM